MASPLRLTPRFSRYAHAGARPTEHEWLSDLRFKRGEHSACHCGEWDRPTNFHDGEMTHA